MIPKEGSHVGCARTGSDNFGEPIFIPFAGGSFSSFVGGSNLGLGVRQRGVVTYRPAPGCVEIRRVESTGGNQTFLSHARVQHVRSKCSWWISVGGEAELTCSART